MVALVSKPPVPKKNAHTQPRRYAQLFTDDAGLTQRGLDNVSKNSTRPPPRRPRYDITEHDVSSHTSIRLELEKTAGHLFASRSRRGHHVEAHEAQRMKTISPIPENGKRTSSSLAPAYLLIYGAGSPNKHAKPTACTAGC